MLNRSFIFALCLSFAVVGCDMSSPQMAASQPQKPAERDTAAPTTLNGADSGSQSADVNANNATSRPAASSAATTSRPASQPATGSNEQAAPEPPKLPKYIRILEQIEPGQATIEVTVENNRRLLLKTKNVKRFTITRSDSPLAKDRSVALLIDTRGFEWTPTRQTLTLEYNANGDWSVVDEKRP